MHGKASPLQLPMHVNEPFPRLKGHKKGVNWAAPERALCSLSIAGNSEELGHRPGYEPYII
uniref:Uncharacterized protein n=1 Tax=Anguilla anguilla TaxID=7936 RepID=A0A0E9V9P8_ANGAN